MRSPAEFRALRDFLNRRMFTEEAICKRYSLGVINDFRALVDGREPEEIRDALGVLVRLFLDSVPVSEPVVRAYLSGEELDLLSAFGLLGRDLSVPDAVRGSVLLYPVRGLFIISDSFHNPGIKNSPEIVYPAITANTHRFLAMIPDTRCESFLELCGGTGIAALCAARNGAQRSVSTDITARATYFAEFNARLNDLPSFSALQGDLYAPVAGQTFQRIACHPPYVAALRQELIYRDGGEDGELVTRRVFQQAAKFLDTNGRLYCTAVINELSGQPAEQRIRQMLEEREREFDVVVVAIVSNDPLEYFFKEARKGKERYEDLRERERVIQRLGIERMTYASVIVRRTGSGKPLTLRRQLSPRTRWQDIEWLLDLEAAFADPDAIRPLLYAKPRAGPAVRSRLEQTLESGRWKYSDCDFSVTVPFAAELKAPPWTAMLLERMTGERTVSDLLEEIQKAGVAPPGASPEEFTRFVLFLARNGFAELPGFPIAARDLREDIR
jgi:methylase of polypeptide subunit release factors